MTRMVPDIYAVLKPPHLSMHLRSLQNVLLDTKINGKL